MGITIPAVRGIGGDYYEFIEKHDAGFVTTVGDVSGKGPTAALLMAALHGAVRAQTTTGRSVLDQAVTLSALLKTAGLCLRKNWRAR